MVVIMVADVRGKRPPSSPVEPEGGRMSSFVVIIRRYRDKRPPYSPVEPEGGRVSP